MNITKKFHLKKPVAWTILVCALFLMAAGGAVFWYTNVHHRFCAVTEGKVYKSGHIPPNELDSFLLPYKIKAVVDFLDPGVKNKALSSARQADIDAEDKKIKAINRKYGLKIKHIHIPSKQIPTRKTLNAFYAVIDNAGNYPLLLHCYHGVGRSVLYGAIYRIEKEGWNPVEAQEKTRFFKFLVDSPFYHSSFARGSAKGDFLLSYTPRRTGQNCTYNQLRK